MFQVHVYKYFLGLMCGVVFLYSGGNWEKYALRSANCIHNQ